MQVGELFAGIGGLAEGFKSAGFDIAWANEYDRHACVSYRANHSHSLIEGDIKTINAKDLSKVDVLTGGFPCQAFSMAGHRRGFNDYRGELFFDVVRFLNDLKPKAFLLENVKGLLNHDEGRTFDIVLAELKKLGYTVIYKVLRTCDYCDSPQKRERIFIIGFSNCFNAYNFAWPCEKPCKLAWWDILEERPDEWFILNDNNCVARPILAKYKELKSKTIYTYAFREVELNTDEYAYTLMVRWDRRGESLFKHEGHLRGFTIRERLRLQGFREDFLMPVSHRQAVKQIGNAVSPPVIALLAAEIKRVLEVDYSSYDLVLK